MVVVTRWGVEVGTCVITRLNLLTGRRPIPAALYTRHGNLFLHSLSLGKSTLRIVCLFE